MASAEGVTVRHWRPWDRQERHARERGAAAVEFALVVPILAVMVLGILDLGLYFSDTQAVRNGLREAARSGAVKNFGSCTTGNNVTRVACNAADQIGAIGGPVYVRVEADPSWQENNYLTVCAMVKENGVSGFTPLPNNDIITGEQRMRIEQGPTTDPGTVGSAGGAIPAGTNWNWCGP